MQNSVNQSEEVIQSATLQRALNRLRTLTFAEGFVLQVEVGNVVTPCRRIGVKCYGHRDHTDHQAAAWLPT